MKKPDIHSDDVLVNDVRRLPDSNHTICVRNKSRMTGSPVNSCAGIPVTNVTIGDSYTDIGNITATPTSGYSYIIFGNITYDGNPLSGVTVSSAGVTSGTDTTDALGDYVIYFMWPGDYTVTPSKDGYSFTPVSITVTDGNREQDFVASAVEVSGTITLSGNGFLEDATLSLTDESDETSDVNGEFTFGPVEDGEKVLTPSKIAYEFDPVSLEFTVDRESQDGKDFEATLVGYTFLHRRTITIDHTKVSSNLTNYPLYVYVSDLDKAHLRSDGEDIIFYLENDTTRLSFEIERYDDSGATGVLHGWVKVPTVSSTEDTVIYMYYDSEYFTQPDSDEQYGSEDVWSENYLGAWHMKDDPDNEHIKDSTGAGYTSTKSAAGGPAQASGIADYSQQFTSGSSHRVVTGHNAAMMTANKTISFFLYLSGGSTYGFFDKGFGSGFNIHRTSAGKLTFRGMDNSDVAIRFDGNTSLGTGSWYYCTAVYGNNGSVVHKLYINKNDETLSNESTTDSGVLKQTDTSDLVFGAIGSGFYMLGKLDEVRFSSDLKTKAQHDAEFDNMYDVGNFISLGAETDDTKVTI